MALPVDDPKRTDFGPYQFITEKVLKKLNSPSLRLFGVDHIALAWMAEDKEWTTEKGSQHNNLASNTVPLLDRAAPPAAEAAAAPAAWPAGAWRPDDGHDGWRAGMRRQDGGGMMGGMAWAG